MSATTGDPSGEDDVTGPFRMDFARVEELARRHDGSSAAVAAWADHDPDFGQRFLATHGLVAWATHLRLARHVEQRREAASALAAQHAAAAAALRSAGALVRTTDGDNAAAWSPVDPQK